MASSSQHRGFRQPGETEEEVVQGSNHSDHSVHVSDEEGSQNEVEGQNRSTEGCSKFKRSVDMTSSGKNDLNIRKICKSQMGQDQVSGEVSVLCWLTAPVANVPWKPPGIW